ncbi:MAG: helix-turn-helix domain-containing protein [Actinomycetota bacterium]|nr:helix-turn-helix domain-containing protein [Actinomycetota bacterium]
METMPKGYVSTAERTTSHATTLDWPNSPRPVVGFTAIPHEVAQGSRLSYRARGLLAFMLASPGQRHTVSSFARNQRDGRDAIKAALRKLEEHGYLPLDGEGQR